MLLERSTLLVKILNFGIMSECVDLSRLSKGCMKYNKGSMWVN